MTIDPGIRRDEVTDAVARAREDEPRRVAEDALREIVKIERALDNVTQSVADSLQLADRKAIEKRIEALKDTVKKWMADSREYSFQDHELGGGAALQQRGGGFVYDTKLMVEKDAGVTALVELARMGMVRIDDKMLDTFRKGGGSSSADVAWRYRMPAQGTFALYVDYGKKGR